MTRKLIIILLTLILLCGCACGTNTAASDPLPPAEETSATEEPAITSISIEVPESAKEQVKAEESADEVIAGDDVPFSLPEQEAENGETAVDPGNEMNVQESESYYQVETKEENTGTTSYGPFQYEGEQYEIP